MPVDPKPSWQTMEFWLTLLGQIMPMLVLLHVINQGDVQTLQGACTQIIQAAFALIVSGGVIWKFVHSRTEVKKAHLEVFARK